MERHHPDLVCCVCGAKIYWDIRFKSDPNALEVEGLEAEPPPPLATCPNCGQPVDTTAAYPVLAGFAPEFAALKAAYAGFSPVTELHRDSLDAPLAAWLKTHSEQDVASALSAPDGRQWFLQRAFYRSSASFYRALEQLLAQLCLERKAFQTWSYVSGYYSRFYFIQAFFNLVMATWVSTARYLIFFDGSAFQVMSMRSLKALRVKGSHEIWWALMEAMRVPADYGLDDMSFVKRRFVYSPERRNELNYRFDWLSGYPELDWFDQSPEQMMGHFNPRRRPDRDITNQDRYFTGRDPEQVDIADFFDDEAQIVWSSLATYLTLLRRLEITQTFVTVEKIRALCELHIGDDYPDLSKGIVQASAEALGA